jgi:hypothetical protein
MAKKPTPKQPAKPAPPSPKVQKPASIPVPKKPGANPTGNTGKPVVGAPIKPQLPVNPNIKLLPVIKPVSPSKRDLGKPLVKGEKISAEMYAIGKGSRLCQSLIMALKHEGTPGYVSDDKYLERFARYGWDDEEDASALMIMSLWGNGISRLRIFGQALLTTLQTDEPLVTSYDPTRSYTSQEQDILLEQADAVLENPTEASEDEIAFAQALILDFRFGVDLTIDTVTTGTVTGNNLPSSPQAQSWITNWADQPGYWTSRIEQAYNAVGRTAEAFWLGLQSGQLDVPAYVQAESSEELFRYIMGEVEIRYFSQLRSEQGAGLVIEPVGNRTVVNFFIPIVNETPDVDYVPTERNIVHELGHVFDWRTGQYARRRVTDEPILENALEFRPGSASYLRNLSYGFDPNFRPINSGNLSEEDWADSFLAWIYDAEDGFSETSEGMRRQAIFEGWLEDSIAIAYGRGNPQSVQTYIQSTYDQLFEENSDSSSTPITITLNAPIQVREIPYSGNQSSYIQALPTASSGTITVIGIIARENTPAIANTDWLLVESNGVIGFVPISAIPIDTSGLPQVDLATVNMLTGREYISYSAGEHIERNAQGEITYRQNYAIWERVRTESED